MYALIGLILGFSPFAILPIYAFYLEWERNGKTWNGFWKDERRQR